MSFFTRRSPVKTHVLLDLFYLQKEEGGGGREVQKGIQSLGLDDIKREAQMKIFSCSLA